jgi:hypothetical protein
MFSRKSLNNSVNNNRSLVTANNARMMREANGFGTGALVTANNARMMREANGARKQIASHPLNNNKKSGGFLSRFRAGPKAVSGGSTNKKSGGFLSRFSAGSGGSTNNKLKRFANAKGITNVRAYNKNTTTRNNLMNKNSVLYFNVRNKKPVLAYVPMRLRDSNVSALGKILGRDYEFQTKGPMGPGHYNKQFVRQLAIMQSGGPNVPMLPEGPNVPMLPEGPNVPNLPFTGNNNNALRKRCAALMAEKMRIEEQLRALGCDPKNG